MHCFSRSAEISASLAIFLTPVLAVPANLRTTDIHLAQGLTSAQGLSQRSTTTNDKSKLKYQIVGIVGAYLCWTVFTLILIFTVGRKLRRKALTTKRISNTSIMRFACPPVQLRGEAEPGLRSPSRLASLKPWAKGHSQKDSIITVSTIDEKVVEMDRAKDMDEMAKLYAAVMAHDEEMTQKPRYSGQTSPRSPQSASRFAIKPSFSRQTGPTPPMSPQYPPEFQHLANNHSPVQTSQGQTHNQSHSLTSSPLDEISQSTDISRASSRLTKASPLSFISTEGHKRTGSNSSRKSRPGHISIRGQTISAPLVSASDGNASVYSEERSLTPRIYNPGRPPPIPVQEQQVTTEAREVEQQQRSISNVPPPRGSLTINTSSNNLPFRQLYQDSLKSAPSTKTTFLERNEHSAGSHPKTGLPQTPYSPYVPYTPITPITPRRLMTKEDRKRVKRAETMKVLSEDDMVRSDEDMWGEVV